VHQTEMEWLRLKMQHKHEHEISVLKQRHEMFEKDSKQAMDDLMCALLMHQTCSPLTTHGEFPPAPPPTHTLLACVSLNPSKMCTCSLLVRMHNTSYVKQYCVVNSAHRTQC
jgi:hypothetical protein